MTERCASYVATNRSELGPDSDSLRWLRPEEIVEAESERQRLVSRFPASVQWSFGETKPHYGALSLGCARCGAGAWSCLFVNGRCNADCFFCPAAQGSLGLPSTSTLTFQRPKDYADYLVKGQFQGVGISGGEPLLTLERTADFIRTVRDRFGDELYVWVYTNGKLMTPAAATVLRQAGVDEVRFNLHASGYRLDGLRAALAVIPTVTVEIPAIPEETDRLFALLPVLSGLGVKHLNLHQLRCTPHNLRKMIGRPYRFVHGPKVTVLESEHLALRLVGRAAEAGLDLGVQYCAFAFKNPHQTMGSRRRWAPLVKAPWEDVTATGAIRTVYIAGGDDDLSAAAQRLHASGAPSAAFELDRRRGRLYLPLSRVSTAVTGSTPSQLVVEYTAAVLVARPTYHFPPTRIEINNGLEATVERRLLSPPLTLSVTSVDRLSVLAFGPWPSVVPEALEPFARFECLPHGLACYG